MSQKKNRTRPVAKTSASHLTTPAVEIWRNEDVQSAKSMAASLEILLRRAEAPTGCGQKGCTVDQKFTSLMRIFAARMQHNSYRCADLCGFYADSIRSPVEHRENTLFRKKKLAPLRKDDAPSEKEEPRVVRASVERSRTGEPHAVVCSAHSHWFWYIH